MLIEIVSHCYAVQNTHFAGALRYQISSLELYKPKNCDIQLTVCADIDDDLTTRVLQWGRKKTEVSIKIIHLSTPYMTRRSIGRNIAAKDSQADLVWFADVDECFYDGLLSRLCEFSEDGWKSEWNMIYPKMIQISRDHKTGDRYLLPAVESEVLVDINPSDFVDWKYTRAIGGVQIVRGTLARKHGYLDGEEKWLKPREDGIVLGDFSDDCRYRRFCGDREKKVEGVDLPGLYRIRHTRTSYQEPKL